MIENGGDPDRIETPPGYLDTWTKIFFFFFRIFLILEKLLCFFHALIVHPIKNEIPDPSLSVEWRQKFKKSVALQ